MRKVIQTIRCASCQYKFAEIVEDNGRRELEVFGDGIALRALDNDKNKAEIVCPNCKKSTIVDKDFFAGF